MSIVKDLSNKTVMEIKSYAKKNNIDLGDAKTRAQLLDVISNHKPKKVVKVEAQIPNKELEKIAVFAERNIFWNEVGALEKGYNIITKEASEKWISHKAVRIATPQEVALYYGEKI